MPDYKALTFPPPPPSRPYVILNMVTSLDGRASIDGSERGLGSETDQRLMRELRLHADVVLVGAGTLRAVGASPRLRTRQDEGLRASRGKTRVPLAAVLSGSGVLPLDRPFFSAPDFDAIVYVAEDCAAGTRAALEATGRRVVPVPRATAVSSVLHHLKLEVGAEMLLLEGGPRLNRMFFQEDAVDEWFLTLGPVVAGSADPPAVAAGPDEPLRLPMQLVHCEPNEMTGEVYLRYRRSRR